jgi:hypothetical protein
MKSLHGAIQEKEYQKAPSNRYYKGVIFGKLNYLLEIKFFLLLD